MKLSSPPVINAQRTTHNVDSPTWSTIYRHVPKGFRQIPQSQEQSTSITIQIPAKYADFSLLCRYISTQLLQQATDSNPKSASKPAGSDSGLESQYSVSFFQARVRKAYDVARQTAVRLETPPQSFAPAQATGNDPGATITSQSGANAGVNQPSLTTRDSDVDMNDPSEAERMREKAREAQEQVCHTGADVYRLQPQLTPERRPQLKPIYIMQASKLE